MDSAVASGKIYHHRFSPRAHGFNYPLSMLYLDLQETPQLFAQHPLWSWNRSNVASVLRKDHLRREEADLSCALRACIEEFSGERAEGPISLLTQPRYFGYCMNPISVYFVWSADRSALQWLVLEVHNTPWDEQQIYVLKAPAQQDGHWSIDFDKAMHVSPFMDMNMHYRLHFQGQPRERIRLRLDNWRDDQRLFSANLELSLKPATRRELSRVLIRYPFMTAKIAMRIYWQALRLKLKGVPYVPYPGPHLSKPAGESE